VEIGSNDGICLRHFAKRGIRHLGIEPSANVADAARKSGVETLCRFFDNTLAEKIASEHGQADVIFAANLMCHISRIHPVVDGIRRLLKPGGVFIFSSHIRAFGPYTPYWAKQWFRYYVLRPLGFPMHEPEFGDRFFTKAASGTFESEQYTHIPSLGEVLGQVREAGFHLVERGYRDSIAPEDAGLPGDSCMLFVCKKPGK